MDQQRETMQCGICTAPTRCEVLGLKSLPARLPERVAKRAATLNVIVVFSTEEAA
ncbi:hypothetical protein ACEN2J_03615 [Pseudorhodobacter sp. W20_MBD10_FR17]|uniref:hypothetical protein n=1 Tax=Pseudorhodobacter sp. W20_MBD10_FR17 TaxID=3240266 RepID=UPI003F95B86F